MSNQNARILKTIPFIAFGIVYSILYYVNPKNPDGLYKFIWAFSIIGNLYLIRIAFKPQKFHDNIEKQRLEKLNNWKSSKKVNSFLVLLLAFFSFGFYLSVPMYASVPLLLVTLGTSIYLLKQMIRVNDVNIKLYEYLIYIFLYQMICRQIFY
tara:strand:- start:1236 stop:1694 length:459 start_codon:yes stop_codon:yes gene_type:complete